MEDLERKSEKTLLERYQAILHTAMDAFWLTDLEGRILEVNGRALDMTGFSREELLHMGVPDLDARMTEAEVVERIAEVRREGEGRFETVHRRKDGGLIDVEVSVTFLPLEGGRFVSFIRDVTSRKQGETALRASEERYRSLIERSWDIIYELSLDGYFTFVSPSWTRMIGHAPDKVVGRHFGDFVHPDDLEACQEWLDQVIGAGHRVPGLKEYRVRKLDGSWLWNESNVVPILGADGKVVGFEGIAKDITERMAFEEKLQAKNEELDLYFSSALDLLCIADTGGHFLRLNPEWEKTLGWPLGELEGKLFLDFVHPEDLKTTMDAVSTLGSGKEVTCFVNRYRRRDGSYRWLEWRSRPRGELIYAVARDITDRLLAERRVEGLLAEKELILKEVHHRVKNNLSAVLSLLSLESADLEDPRSRAAFENLEMHVQGMALLYDQLYRSDNPMDVPLADYIPALVEQILSNYPGRERVVRETRIAGVILDSKRAQTLGIILNELLSNVMKYAFPDGRGGRLLIALSEAEGRCRLVVQDDGQGLPALTRLESTTDFGLVLVRNLSLQLKGEAELDVPRDWGRGTRFALSFPL